MYKTSITRLASTGEGIGHLQGKTYFIPRTVPGDEIEFISVLEKKNYGRGLLQKILKASPQRISAPCKYYEKCGGCQLQHIEPHWHKDESIKQLHNTLVKFGPGETSILPTISGEAWNYRNSVTFHREHSFQGFRDYNDRQVIDIDTCNIARPRINQLWKQTKPLIAHIQGSLIPRVMLREYSSHNVVIFFLAQEKLVPELQKITSPLKTEALFYYALIDSQHPKKENTPPTPLHTKTPLSISQHIGDIIIDCFPENFSQVNHEVAMMLLEYLLQDIANEQEHQKILDLYCGSGFFSLALAYRGHQVLGIEVSPRATMSAINSSLLNALDDRIGFQTGKVSTCTEKLVENKKKFSTIVIDPPRKGIDKKTLSTLPKLDPTFIYYISCNPITLARDLISLQKSGYQVMWLRPFDMFPQTYHIECMVKLKKNKKV
ncbi:MAG: 23S rRNA (uracil(1939)-C(5))-methyltransferase RlmD [Bdellovibrionales bacterium]|nr:23S rRNA (uracil(1939)-C(5))-methyltransferase RlmD [Bdellovibrionales bacterium]